MDETIPHSVSHPGSFSTDSDGCPQYILDAEPVGTPNVVYQYRSGILEFNKFARSAFNEFTGLFVAQIQAETAKLTARVDQCTQDIQCLREENAQLRQENAQLRQENAKLRQENAQLREENTKLHEELAQLRADVHVLSLRVDAAAEFRQSVTSLFRDVRSCSRQLNETCYRAGRLTHE